MYKIYLLYWYMLALLDAMLFYSKSIIYSYFFIKVFILLSLNQEISFIIEKFLL